MSTTTFDRFLAQLRAGGREKMDGFDRTHFDGLTLPERDQARHLLVAALLNRDTTAAHGLVLLDERSAEPTLREVLARFDAPSYEQAVVAGELWRLTNVPVYSDALGRIVTAFETTDAHTRQTAVVYLQDTMPSASAVAALRRSVREEPDDTVRFSATVELLYAAGRVSSVQQFPRPHADLIDGILHGTRAQRARAADELDAALAR